MLRTKKDVDKHVSDLFSKQKNEFERSLKGYNIARLYFEVKAYEMAQRHLATFLSIKDEHAAGHKLMGKIAEALSDLERALQCYKRSLDLDSNQKDLILKICDLYCQLPVDPDTARYWADRAEKLFPHNDIVFKLRECIVNAEGEPNLKELESLISSELKARPQDVSLYIKMLKLYMDTERIEQAFNYSLKIEEKQIFQHNIDWYYCLSDICEAYQEEVGPQIKLDFCIHYALVLDRLITLLLSEPHFLPNSLTNVTSKNGRSLADTASVLQSFDQFLLKTSVLPLSRENPFKYVHQHMRGQLYFHLASLLLKRAKKDQGNWKEACRYSAALLLVAYTFKADNLYQEVWFNKLENKKPYQTIQQLALLRLSYAGHVLNCLCKEDKAKFIQKIKVETCIPQVRDKIFQRAFSLLGKPVPTKSFFLQDLAFLERSLEFPSAGSLQEYDKVAHKIYPESLHQFVWLSLLRKMENKSKNPPKFQVFEKLQYSCEVLTNGAPETLCQLDTEAFLIAAVYTTNNAMEIRKNMIHRSSDYILCLPPHIGEPLCTEEQTNWWSTAYALYSNTTKDKMSEKRQILRRGLEVIRGVGNHGLDILLVVHIARSFGDQALVIRKRLGEDDQSEEVVALEERAVHYWTLALSLLDKAISNRRIQQPKERLFGVYGKEPSTQEISELREEGRFYIACHHMNVDCLDLAAEEFSKLSLPNAAYNQAKVLKKLALQSEDKQRKTALLTKSKEALYLTMDRIAADRKNPLNLTLQEEIESIEMELMENVERPTPYDDERTDDEDPSFINGSPLQRLNASNGSYDLYSTPRNSPMKNTTGLNISEPSSRHIRPSPERLDSQIRALAYTQENLIKTLVDLRTSSAEQQSSVIETNKAILEELKSMKTNVETLKGNVSDLKKQFDDFQKSKCQHCARSRGPHLKSTEDELEEEEDDNGYEDHLYEYPHVDVDNGYSYNAYNHGVLQGPHRGASNMAYNYQPPPQPGPPMFYPHHQYGPGAAMGQPQMNPLDMSQARPRNYYPHFQPTPGLPFSEGQQLPQFNFRMPPPSQGILPPVSQPIAPPQTGPGFNRIQVVSTDGQMQPTVQQPFIPPTQPKKDFPQVSEPASSSYQSGTASNAPHAFQIALPPSVGASGVSSQPPAILSTPTFVSNTLNQSTSQESQLKSALSGTPISSGYMASPGLFESSNISINKSPKKDSSYDQISGNESEEDTGGHFKPLIPLPAEVAVRTGEENEKVLFEEKAKLFRYIDKEWKERGVGAVKLLLNEAVDRVRLVMRRDQVLKICANHYIKDNMELRTMKDNEKAWIWIAEDFADEEIKAEQFCIRFKTIEIAKAFKVAFDQARKRDKALDEIKPKESDKSTSKVVADTDGPVAVGQVGFGDNFKPPVGSWVCDACYLNNDAIRTSCIACENPKPGSIVANMSTKTDSVSGFKFGVANVSSTTKSTPKSGFGEKFKPPVGSWICDGCYLNNGADRTSCIACEKPKSGAAATESSAKSTKTSGFNFGIPKAPAPETPKQATTGFGGKFNPAPGSWNCKACYLNNKADAVACIACELPKPGAPKVDTSNSTPFKFGFKPATTQPTTPNTFGGLDLTTTSSGFIKPTPQNASSDVIVKPKPLELKFGIPSVSKPSSTVTETPSTTGNANSPANSSKTVLGGFTFTATPKVSIEDKKKEDKKSGSAKESAKPLEPKSVSPFAGFQFTPSKIGTSQPANTFGSSASFLKSFTETPPTLTFGNLSTSTQSPVTGDSAFKSLVTSKTSAFTPTPESPNASKEVPDEFEPSVDFAPVVPLPGLIEIKTGEEDEEVLFDERGKLFRYDQTLKEWKERGIGNVKILKNKESGRCRVLMRREQVLKLCANHYILPEMSLSAMNNSGKAWAWFAQDFSEGEMKTEHLAIRFKTKDIAISFQVVFDKCTKQASSEIVLSNTVPTESCSRSLLEDFKPKKGSWECSTCYVRNDKNAEECIACLTLKDPAIKNVASSKFTFTLPDKFKAFECSACYETNNEDIPNCKFCGCPRPQNSLEKKQDETVSSNVVKPFKFGSPSNNDNNHVFGHKEYTFGNIKNTPASNFAFGNAAIGSDNSVKSIFGTTANIGPFSSKPETKESSIEFRFGSPQKFEFNFTGPRARSPSKTPKSPGTPNDSANYGTEDDGEVSSDTDNIFFQPVIPLPPKVDVKTGEEDEVSVYSQRAKLYRFDSGEWKERGTGDIKILFNEKENKSRLLMRREQVLKVCLNHCLSKDIKFQRKNEKTWLWAASDFSEGEAKLEKFAIRFKSQEIAEQFERMVDQYKDGNVVSESEPNQKPKNNVVKTLDFSDQALNLSEPDKEPMKENSSISSIGSTPLTSASAFSFKLNTPKMGGFGLASRFGVAASPITSESFTFGSSPKISNSKFVITDISVIEEKKASNEQKEKAEKLQLPPNFYLYEKKEPCSGCRGCEECSKEVEVVYERTPTEEQLSKAALLQLPPSFFFYEYKPDCPGCRGCSDGEEPTKPSPVPAKIRSDDKTSSEAASGAESVIPKDPEGAHSSVPTFGSFSGIKSANTICPKEDTSIQSGSFFGAFSTTEDFSFAALASQKTDDFVPFKTSTLHIFEGAGRPLFAGRSFTPNSSGHDDEVAPSPDIHFEPVVPLPELVEAKTGEENETPIFNERAKLYRFDKDTSQWKERGVGQFKILKHNVKCQYRLLLRREQIHKVACNHYITDKLELNPMVNNENSLCWSAMDFTEGELISELFAIKFKNKDLLNKFKTTFNESKQDICDNGPQDESTESQVESSTQQEEEQSQPIIEEPPADVPPEEEVNDAQNPENSQDDQEEEDDDEVMFEKRVTLTECINNTQEYKHIGMGSLTVKYDDSIFGARIQMTNDSQEMLCDHFIALQTCLRVKGCEAFWSVRDMVVDPPKRRQFKAIFSSKNAVEEFERVFDEGKNMAIESEIVETDDPVKVRE